MVTGIVKAWLPQGVSGFSGAVHVSWRLVDPSGASLAQNGEAHAFLHDLPCYTSNFVSRPQGESCMLLFLGSQKQMGLTKT